MGHARALLTLPRAAQLALARDIVARGLTVRETERRVQQHDRGPAPKLATADPDVVALEQRLSETLGARVRIQAKRTGAGRITIDYHSMDELEGLLGRIS